MGTCVVWYRVYGACFDDTHAKGSLVAFWFATADSRSDDRSDLGHRRKAAGNLDMSVAEDTTPEFDEKALAREEMEIARKYISKISWVMVTWGLGNFFFWLSLWPLTFLGILPLWATFILATLSITLSYLPTHEAQHSNFAAAGKPMRWLNELIGHTSTIPLVLPYRMHWIIHREHHAHTNDPVKDPDYGIKADGWWGAIWASLQSRQPGNRDSVELKGDILNDPAVKPAMREAMALSLFHWTTLAVLAWSGYALEALLIWWLPRNIALTYIQLLLSWAPHFPMEVTGRYRDTRAFKYRFGNIGALGMEYHIIHHLHPAIPLDKTPAAYRE